MLPPLELIIFDCDGVLVDSEPLANRVLCEAILELGLPASIDDVTERFKGRSLADCIRLIESDLGRAVPNDFLDRLNEATYEAFHRHLRPVPGALELVRRLRVPHCVASSGSHEKMRLTLGLTELLPYFDDHLFSASEVERGKPAPDLFLHAALRMGVRPERCWVVEDSVPGVRGAVAAGMHVIGLAREEVPERLAEAGARVITSLDEVTSLIDSRRG